MDKIGFEEWLRTQYTEDELSEIDDPTFLDRMWNTYCDLAGIPWTQKEILI